MRAQWIDPDQQWRAFEDSSHARHIIERVITDKRVSARLPFSLANAFKVDHDAHAWQRLAARGNCGINGDLHELNHVGQFSRLYRDRHDSECPG